MSVRTATCCRPFGMIGTVLGGLPDSQGLHQRGGRALQYQPDGALSAARGGPEAIYLIERLVDDGGRASWASIASELRRKKHAARNRRCPIRARSGRSTIAASSRKKPRHGAEARLTWRASRRARKSRKKGAAALPAGSASIKCYRAGPPVRPQPEYAEIRFNPRPARRPCSWAPRTRARATRPCSSRS